MVALIQSLQGKVEEVRIDVLYADLLYARIRLRSHHKLHTLKASLDDGLRLAVRERCPLVVAETILDELAIDLTEYGETSEQQLATVENILRHPTSCLPPRSKTADNLDFSAGLHHWTLYALSESASYTIEPHSAPANRACLILSLTQGLPDWETTLLHRTNFPAHPYQGKRLRARTYIKTDGPPARVSPVNLRPLHHQWLLFRQAS